jgi:hypothetical protein
LAKKNVEQEVQLNELRRLASSAEDDKKKAEGLQKLYDVKVAELADLCWAHDSLTSDMRLIVMKLNTMFLLFARSSTIS